MFWNLSLRPCSNFTGNAIAIFIMTKPTEILQDIAQLAGGAAGLLGGAGQQIRDDVKTRFEDMADRMDLVPREELERVEALLHKSLEQQKDMLARIETLEAKKK